MTNPLKIQFEQIIKDLAAGTIRLDDTSNTLTRICFKDTYRACKHAKNKTDKYFTSKHSFNVCDIITVCMPQHKKFDIFKSNSGSLRNLVYRLIKNMFGYGCCKLHQDDINNFLNILDYGYLGTYTHDLILKDPYCNNLYVNKIIENGSLNTQILRQIIDYRIEKVIRIDDNETDPLPINLAELFLSKLKLDAETAEVIKLLDIRNFNFHNALAKILDKYDDPDKILNMEFFHAAVTTLPHSRSTVQILLGRNFKLTEECLYLVLNHGIIDAIKYVLHNNKYEIKNDHLKCLIKSTCSLTVPRCNWTEKMKKDNGYKYGRYSDILGSGYTKEAAILLLQEEKCNIDKEIVLFSIKHKIELPVELVSKSVEMDQDILNCCHANMFYPNYDFKFISHNLLELQKACCCIKAGPIKDLLKKNKDLVPDKQCMLNATKAKLKENQIKMLIDAGGKVLPEHLLHMSILHQHTKEKLMIVEANKSHQEQIKELKLQLEIAKMKKIDLDDNTKYFPIKKRKKEDVPPPMKEYFDQKKVSFYDIRKFMLDIIKKEGWIIKDVGIRIPSELCQKLGIENGYILLEEVDNFIGLFYKNKID